MLDVTRHSLAAGLLLLLATAATARGQGSDDPTWQSFLGYLRDSPPANGPLEMIQGFRKDQVVRGAAPEEADRRLNIVLRLMRERTDAWPLMFDKIYASTTPNFSTRPNALLLAAVEGRPAGRALDVGLGQGRNAVALATFRILRFEDTDDTSDWDPQRTSLVRLVAQKQP